MKAIHSRDVSTLLRLGSNAVQAASQILRLQNRPVKCSVTLFDEVELQGIAYLRLNGIAVDLDDVFGKANTDPLNQFALGIAPMDLMKSKDPFVKEIACLRGTEDLFRHVRILDTAFDRDEQLNFDIMNQLHPSSYF